VLELPLNLTADEALEACFERGLAVRSMRELARRPRGRHWHLHAPGRTGTLELTEWNGNVSVKVHPLRDGGWASGLARELAAKQD
jgi:hypothetical protein